MGGGSGVWAFGAFVGFLILTLQYFIATGTLNPKQTSLKPYTLKIPKAPRPYSPDPKARG